MRHFKTWRKGFTGCVALHLVHFLLILRCKFFPCQSWQLSEDWWIWENDWQTKLVNWCIACQNSCLTRSTQSSLRILHISGYISLPTALVSINLHGRKDCPIADPLLLNIYQVLISDSFCFNVKCIYFQNLSSMPFKTCGLLMAEIIES